MSKDKLRELLDQLWFRDISADDAFNELEGLIDRIELLEEAGDKLTPGAAAALMWSEIEAWHKAKEAKP